MNMVITGHMTPLRLDIVSWKRIDQSKYYSKGTFVSAGGSWNLIAFTYHLGKFIDRDYGPVNPAWEVGS